MTPVHTTPPQKPNPSNYEKGNIYVSPASDETANEPNDIANYGDKEKTIVDPSGDSGKKPEGVFVTKKALQIGGAALAGIVALSVGIATFNNKDKKEDPRPTETIESIYEEELTSIQESSIESSQASQTTETTAENISIDIEKYADMDYAEYIELPVDERLPYAQYLINESLTNGEYEFCYGWSDYEKYRLEFTEVSKENSGQEIMDNFMFTLQMSMAQSIGNKIDIEQGEKILSSTFYITSKDSPSRVSNIYATCRDDILDMEGPTVLLEKNIVTKTSELLSGYDKANNPIEYKLVEFYEENLQETRYARFIYYKSSNNGTEFDAWLLDVTANSLSDMGEIEF